MCITSNRLCASLCVSSPPPAGLLPPTSVSLVLGEVAEEDASAVAAAASAWAATWRKTDAEAAAVSLTSWATVRATLDPGEGGGGGVGMHGHAAGDGGGEAGKVSYFNWWNCALCSGVLLGVTVVVYVQEQVGWGDATVLLAAVMGCSLVVYLSGWRTYRASTGPAPNIPSHPPQSTGLSNIEPDLVARTPRARRKPRAVAVASSASVVVASSASVGVASSVVIASCASVVVASVAASVLASASAVITGRLLPLLSRAN
ncbi:putative NRT1/PTR-like transporter [Hordeum vulgare]|nr:putative NRT1/PTR-like transporter [Hordeum vulgare]